MGFSTSFLGQTFQSIGWLFFIIFLGLFLDSSFVAQNYYNNAQWINNVLVLLVFLYFFVKGTKRVKEQLIYALIIGFIGEYIFCKGLGMYTYRLQNVPLYVPFGHAVVFLGIYFFSKKPKTKVYAKKIERVLAISIAVYALLFLIFKSDIFGFVLTILVFLSLWKHPKERLFYLSMYAVVSCLELVGTGFNCWVWPKVAFDYFTYLPSANPPAGICLFYFGLDRGTMSIYKRRNKKVWKRFQRLHDLTV